MSDFFSSQPSQLLGTKKSKILVDFYQIPLQAGTSYTLLTFKIDICLFENQNYKRKDRERTSICLFYSPDGHNGQTLARQKPRVFRSGFPWGGKGPSSWTIFCFSRHSSKGLCQKQSNQDISWCLYGMPKSQVASLPTVPLRQPSNKLLTSLQ